MVNVSICSFNQAVQSLRAFYILNVRYLQVYFLALLNDAKKGMTIKCSVHSFYSTQVSNQHAPVVVFLCDKSTYF